MEHRCLDMWQQHLELHTYLPCTTTVDCHLLQLAVSDPDILTFDQAIQDTENREAWKEAMMKEIQQLEDYGTWDQVPITDAKMKALPLTWVL